MTTPPLIPNYDQPTRISRLAKIAFWSSLLAIPLFFTFLPALTAIILGTIAAHRIRKDPTHLAGLAYAQRAQLIGTFSALAFAALTAIVPFLDTSRGNHNRGYCAANLRGIAQSMIIYAADHNDTFPVVPFAPYSPALNNLSATAVDADAERTIQSLYAPDSPLRGSPTAGLWILILRNQISTKQTICRSDTWSTHVEREDSAGKYFNHFQSPTQLSYSLAYPYKSDGSVGKWWTVLIDDKLPILADMAPEQGTGTPARILNPTKPPRKSVTWRSTNHNGDGQNVAFSDVHVEWTSTPTVGHNNDNIFTYSHSPSRGPAELGGIFINKTPIHLNADKPPFDIVMVPVRNEFTGKL